MIDPFESPRITLRRARHHIDDFKSRVATVTNSYEHRSYVIDVNPDGITETHKIQFRKEFFEDMSCVVFDAANNIRSALGQMSYIIGFKFRNSHPKSCSFPVAETERFVRDKAKGQTDLPDEIRDLFVSFKPYKRPTDAIWVMNELANSSKHFGLIPVGIGGFVGIHMGGGITMFDKSRWDATKYEMKLSVSPRGTEPHQNVNAAFDIAIDHPDPIIRSKSPVPFLDAVPSTIESILVRTEAECRRIGLFP
jgi:hypothetical protein